jgi:hypothetical protein
MDPRLFNVPEFRIYTGPLVANTAIAIFPPDANHNGRFLLRAVGWERSGSVAFTPLTYLVRARTAPLTLFDALAGTIAVSRNGYPCSYAAGAVSDLSATMQYEPPNMEFLLPNEGLFLFPAIAAATSTYTLQLYPDTKQSGR